MLWRIAIGNKRIALILILKTSILVNIHAYIYAYILSYARIWKISNLMNAGDSTDIDTDNEDIVNECDR